MAVIADYTSETGCRIIVHDDCIQPPEEVEKIIQRVSDLVIQEEIRKHSQSTA